MSGKRSRHDALLAVFEEAREASQWTKAFDAAEATVAADSSFAPRIATQGFGLLAITIVRDSTASPANKALAQRAAERAIALQASPSWSAFHLAAQAARAAGDKDAARKHLASAIEKANGNTLAMLQGELKELDSGH